MSRRVSSGMKLNVRQGGGGLGPAGPALGPPSSRVCWDMGVGAQQRVRLSQRVGRHPLPRLRLDLCADCRHDRRPASAARRPAPATCAQPVTQHTTPAQHTHTHTHTHTHPRMQQPISRTSMAAVCTQIEAEKRGGDAALIPQRSCHVRRREASRDQAREPCSAAKLTF